MNMRKSHPLKQLIPLLPLLALAGCGGTDGLSNGYPTSPSGATKPVWIPNSGGSAMATWAVGNVWKYAVSGTVTKDYLNASNAVQTMSGQITNGTLVRSVSAAPSAFPAGTFQVTESLTYTIQGSVPTVETYQHYVSQGSDGSLTDLGVGADGIGVLFSTGTGPIVPGTFAQNKNLSTQPSGITFNPVGDAGEASLLQSFAPLSQSTLASQGGNSYTVWNSHSSETQTWNQEWLYYVGGATQYDLPVGWLLNWTTNISTNDFWVPSLGAPVKSHWDINESDNALITWTFKAPSFTYTSTPLNKVESLDLYLVSRS